MNLFLEEAPEEMREDLVFLEACEISMDRANLAANVAMQLNELENRALAVKHMASGTDFESLVAYYEEAGEKEAETSEKNQGLLSRAWAAIKKFFQSLFGTMKKSTDQIDDNATATVPSFFKDLAGKIGKFIQKVGEFIGQHKVLSLCSAVAAIITGGTIFKILKMHKAGDMDDNGKKETTDGKWAKQFNNQLSAMDSQITGMIDGLNKVEADGKIVTDTQASEAWHVLTAIRGDLASIGISVPEKGNRANAFVVARNAVNAIGGAMKFAFTWVLNKFKKKAGGDSDGGVKEESWNDDPADDMSWDEIDAMLNVGV